MADQDQLAQLRQGVEQWNMWRRQHPEVACDLFRADLREADLRRADLSVSDLREADLNRATLIGVDLRGAILLRANLRETYLNGADLREAHLNGAHLDGAALNRADLREADLSSTDLSGAHLREADLREADFTDATLIGADFTGATLIEAHLRGAHLNDAHLNDAHLTGAILKYTDLSRADLSGADLSRADLGGADLSRADLSGANLSGADLTRAAVGWTRFTNADLRAVKGLETIEHIGPSSIGIDTLYRSQGQIPENFLRMAGIPEDFLTYLPSLMNRAIEYYTCFLSYSSKDQDFTERLHADLQSKGVRCWFAPHDLRPGTWIRPSIDEAIRLYDKLILILSHNALESGWVQYEAEIAMHKERERKSLVLFPIRIDESIMTCQESWASTLRARHIGDFTAWKQHESYQQGLKRLLRDLQPEKPQKSRSS